MARRPSRRNSALKFYVNGKRAQQLDGLTDIAGNALSAYDTAVTRAVSGLKRRTMPIVSRGVRQNYRVKAGTLRDKFRVETGTAGRRADRSDYLSVWASTRRISLIDFGGKWRKRQAVGATANISGSPKAYDSAFIASVKGRRAIRVRSFESTGRRAGRGPLQMLYGPSPFEMLSGLDHKPARATRDAVMAELTVFYTTELRRQWRLRRGL